MASSLFREIVLGTTQGITEFLPVSSSGHLVLMSHFFGIVPPQLIEALAYHMGTLVAVVIVLRREIIRLFYPDFQRRKCWMLLITTMTTSVLGFGLHHYVSESFGSPSRVSAFLLITALLLTLPAWVRPKEKPVTHKDLNPMRAIFIGIIQGLSALPGISRSGSTLSASFLVGLDRKDAVEYSFLAAIPVIAGAFTVEVLSNWSELGSVSVSKLTLVGVAISGVTGWMSLIWLLRFLQTKTLVPFAIYCAVLGGVGLASTLWR